jgi:hypothetical protein
LIYICCSDDSTSVLIFLMVLYIIYFKLFEVLIYLINRFISLDDSAQLKSFAFEIVIPDAILLIFTFWKIIVFLISQNVSFSLFIYFSIIAGPFLIVFIRIRSLGYICLLARSSVVWSTILILGVAFASMLFLVICLDVLLVSSI